MTENQKPQRCDDCGEWVPAGAGVLTREERGGDWVSVVRHVECPGGDRQVAQWAVYGEGITPAGNRARGVRLVSGTKPEPDAVPLNDEASSQEAMAAFDDVVSGNADGSSGKREDGQ